MRGKFIKSFVGLLFLSGVLCTVGTAAYLSDYEIQPNTVAVGAVTTEIEEDFPDPTPTPIDRDPEYVKKIWIGNFSGGENGFQTDCYVRMSLSYSNSDIGKAVVLLGMDTANWVYNATDGYYYYKQKLTEGKRTTPLCTGFRIDSARVDATYKDELSDFTINVYEEAVQAQGFKDYAAAWDHYLKPLSAPKERSEEIEKRP